MVFKRPFEIKSIRRICEISINDVYKHHLKLKGGLSRKPSDLISECEIKLSKKI
jgi:hypothetical protein